MVTAIDATQPLTDTLNDGLALLIVLALTLCAAITLWFVYRVRTGPDEDRTESILMAAVCALVAVVILGLWVHVTHQTDSDPSIRETDSSVVGL